MLVTIPFVAASDCGTGKAPLRSVLYGERLGMRMKFASRERRCRRGGRGRRIFRRRHREGEGRPRRYLPLSLWNVTERRIRVLADGRTVDTS